jgi:hypothetical protein
MEMPTTTVITYYVTAMGIPDGNSRDFTEPKPVCIGTEYGMSHRYEGVWSTSGPIQYSTLAEAQSFLNQPGGAFGFYVDKATIKVVKRTVVTTTTEEDVP